MKKLAFAMMMALNIAGASAATITFDELTPGTSGEAIPNGYAGFNWDNFYALDAQNFLGGASGYGHGMVSPTNVGLNAFHNPASFSSATPFTLESAYVTKAWTAGITHFEGYSGASLLYSMDVNSTTTEPTFVTFNWTGLTKVVMSDGNNTQHTAIDNITVNAVPVPAAAWLLGSGLIGLVGVARRKGAA